MRTAYSFQDSLCTWGFAAAFAALVMGCGAPRESGVEAHSPEQEDTKFDPARMTRPQTIQSNFVSGFAIPREAVDARVEGMMIVKCVITVEGRFANCRVIKSLPGLDKAVLDHLATVRTTPVTYKGKPVNVEYTIPLKFKFDRTPPASSAASAPSSSPPPPPPTESSWSTPPPAPATNP